VLIGKGEKEELTKIQHDRGQQPLNHHLLKLEGRSGCELRVLKINQQLIVRKMAANPDYNGRLLAQAQKQAHFNAHNALSLFDAPQVLDQGLINNYQYFDMAYIQGEKFSDFLCHANVNLIVDLTDRLIDYLDFYFHQAHKIAPPLTAIKKKLISLQSQLINHHKFNHQLINQVLLFLEQKIPKSPLISHCCHGDLTFSNMIFTRTGKIYLIDFLDSFIESPLVDLVKLRQDTRFFCSLTIDAQLESHKVCKVKQVLTYMEQRFKAYLDRQPAHLQSWYDYLEIFNLVRIMPYVKQEQEIQFLTLHLQELLF
jgi:aminoglycoside phosphotransferase (APT) family kinase protein